MWLKPAWHFLRFALSPVQHISGAIEIPFVVLGIAASSFVGRVIAAVPPFAFPLAMITALSILAGIRMQRKMEPKLSLECGNTEEFRVVGPRSGAEQRPRLTLLKVRNLSTLAARGCKVQLTDVHPPMHSLELPRPLRWRGVNALESEIPSQGVGFVVIAGEAGSALEESWRVPPEEDLQVDVTAWAEGSRADVRRFRLHPGDGWEWPTVTEIPVLGPR